MIVKYLAEGKPGDRFVAPTGHLFELGPGLLAEVPDNCALEHDRANWQVVSGAPTSTLNDAGSLVQDYGQDVLWQGPAYLAGTAVVMPNGRRVALDAQSRGLAEERCGIGEVPGWSVAVAPAAAPATAAPAVVVPPVVATAPVVVPPPAAPVALVGAAPGVNGSSPDVGGDDATRCEKCHRSFKTLQALKGHATHCKAEKQPSTDQEAAERAAAEALGGG